MKLWEIIVGIIALAFFIWLTVTVLGMLNV